MFRHWLTGTCLVFALILITSEDVRAQRVPNFSRRPTVSPYVNLFNNNQGGVNNYLSFVRPMQQQARFNQMQSNENRFLQQQLLNRQQGFGNSQIQVGGAAPQGMLRQGAQGAGMPSTAATYFNYSHFYPVQQQNRAGRFR